MMNCAVAQEDLYCAEFDADHFIIGSVSSMRNGEVNRSMQCMGLDPCWTGPAIILRKDAEDVRPRALFGTRWRVGHLLSTNNLLPAPRQYLCFNDLPESPLCRYTRHSDDE
jgi:hypothetical protein